MPSRSRRRYCCSYCPEGPRCRDAGPGCLDVCFWSGCSSAAESARTLIVCGACLLASATARGRQWHGRLDIGVDAQFTHRRPAVCELRRGLPSVRIWVAVLQKRRRLSLCRLSVCRSSARKGTAPRGSPPRTYTNSKINGIFVLSQQHLRSARTHTSSSNACQCACVS